MEKLDFTVPEFLRIIWATPEARVTWEPRISKISQAWIELERLAVFEHCKPGALQVVRPEDLASLTQWCYKMGLQIVVLGQQGISNGYSNGTRPYEAGKDWAYRVYICDSPDLAQLFLRLWEERDDYRIGAALGFPQCCCGFFSKWWVEEGWRDLTIPMVGDSHNMEYPIGVYGPFECNILLRWLGVRLVSHLPCSFTCEDTQRLGQKLGLLGIRHGYVQEMDWLTQMLSWPMQYSSLHGIGFVTTPCFKLVFDTTPTPTRVTINRDGDVYPVEAARGNQFPFKDNQITIIRNEHSDNGFSTAEAMLKSHEVIMSAVLKGYVGGVTTNNQKIIDLGCGNGKLLERIINVSPWLVPCGVESDARKHQKAVRRLIKHNPDIHHCDIYDEYYWKPPYGMALISLNRLWEVKEPQAQKLLARLSKNCEHVVFYSYEHSEWPGLRITPDPKFELLEHFSDGNTCAVLTKVRHDSNHLQEQRQT